MSKRSSGIVSGSPVRITRSKRRDGLLQRLRIGRECIPGQSTYELLQVPFGRGKIGFGRRRDVQLTIGSFRGSETMKNPWVKKNPFMSMWLSGANKAAGSARAQVAASVKREGAKATKAATTTGTKQVLDFWNAALGGAARAKPKKRR
jgi:hypothetical protein